MTKIVLSFLLLSGVSAVYAAEPKVLFSSTTVMPGDTVRVILDEVSPDVPHKVLFRGKAYPFFPIGPNAQRALLGIALGTKPGRYPLQIKTFPLKRPRIPHIQSYELEITSTTYAVETITFTPQKVALFKLDHNESLRIHKALMGLSADQYWEGVLDLPVQGKQVGEYGTQRLANGKYDRGFHKGIDLEAKLGTPVLASNGGVVALAYPFKLHGRTVVINHGQGLMTIYLHMKVYNVKPGERVAKGQAIGFVGSTGLSTAPHVHWGVYVHGVPVNPKPWTETEF